MTSSSADFTVVRLVLLLDTLGARWCRIKGRRFFFFLPRDAEAFEGPSERSGADSLDQIDPPAAGNETEM